MVVLHGHVLGDRGQVVAIVPVALLETLHGKFGSTLLSLIYRLTRFGLLLFLTTLTVELCTLVWLKSPRFFPLPSLDILLLLSNCF